MNPDYGRRKTCRSKPKAAAKTRQATDPQIRNLSPPKSSRGSWPPVDRQGVGLRRTAVNTAEREPPEIPTVQNTVDAGGRQLLFMAFRRSSASRPWLMNRQGSLAASLTATLTAKPMDFRGCDGRTWTRNLDFPTRQYAMDAGGRASYGFVISRSPVRFRRVALMFSVDYGS